MPTVRTRTIKCGANAGHGLPTCVLTRPTGVESRNQTVGTTESTASLRTRRAGANGFAFGERDSQAVHAVLEVAFHRVAALMKNSQHAVVGLQHLGREAGDAVASGGIDKPVQEGRADPLALPIVADQEGRLGEIRLPVRVKMGDGQDLWISPSGYPRIGVDCHTTNSCEFRSSHDGPPSWNGQRAAAGAERRHVQR